MPECASPDETKAELRETGFPLKDVRDDTSARPSERIRRV